MNIKGKNFNNIIKAILILVFSITCIGNFQVGVNAATDGNAIVNEAKKHLGKPYSWGNSGPNSFDCSGFTKYVYESVMDKNITGVTTSQVNQGVAISKGDLEAGDLVFFDNTYKGANPTHVGIYIGDGQFVHASSGAGQVVISSLASNSYYDSHYSTARRIINNSNVHTSSNNNPIEDIVFNYQLYSDKYSDLRMAFGNNKDQLLGHFKYYGISEGRSASLVFDVAYYLNHNEDLINAFGKYNYKAAYNHFITVGYKEGRDLSPIFNLGCYIKSNPDVANAYGNNYEGIIKHFLDYGMMEGRKSSENFNLQVYKNNYEDLRNAFGNNNSAYYRHYITNGISEGRVADKQIEKHLNEDGIFDYQLYSDKYSDLRMAFGNNKDQLLGHFKYYGISEGRCSSLVFDVDYYLNHNQDLRNNLDKVSYSSMYNHFITKGYKEGRDLSPILNLGYYIENNPDLVKAYGDDYEAIIQHFLYYGMQEGRQGSENFNVQVYKSKYEDLRNVFGNNNKAYYKHYITNGIYEGRIAK